MVTHNLSLEGKGCDVQDSLKTSIASLLSLIMYGERIKKIIFYMLY